MALAFLFNILAAYGFSPSLMESLPPQGWLLDTKPTHHSQLRKTQWSFPCQESALALPMEYSGYLPRLKILQNSVNLESFLQLFWTLAAHVLVKSLGAEGKNIPLQRSLYSKNRSVRGGSRAVGGLFIRRMRGWVTEHKVTEHLWAPQGSGASNWQANRKQDGGQSSALRLQVFHLHWPLQYLGHSFPLQNPCLFALFTDGRMTRLQSLHFCVLAFCHTRDWLAVVFLRC